MRICVYGAASPTIDPEYIRQTEIMGEGMAKRGHSLVFGGDANGLMGAAARGVKKVARKYRFLLPLGWLFFGTRYIIRSLFGKRPKIRPKKVAENASERMDVYSELKLFDGNNDKH